MTSSIGDFVIEESPKKNLKDLPIIIEEPWYSANSQENIGSGFRKTRIWPLNLKWIEENQDKIKVLKIKNDRGHFQILCETYNKRRKTLFRIKII